MQHPLFEARSPWAIEWDGMPEFVQVDLEPRRTLLVHFESDEDVEKFARLTEQPIGPNVKSVWFPEAEIMRLCDKGYFR